MMLEKFFLIGGGQRKPRKLSDTKVKLLNEESEEASISTNGNSLSMILNGNGKYKTSLNEEDNEDTFDALEKSNEFTKDKVDRK